MFIKEYIVLDLLYHVLMARVHVSTNERLLPDGFRIKMVFTYDFRIKICGIWKYTDVENKDKYTEGLQEHVGLPLA